MTKEQKSAEQLAQEIVEEYGPLIENPALESQLETAIIKALKDREAITWPTDLEMFKECSDSWTNFPSQDNEGHRPNRGGYKAGFLMCFLWLKARIGGKRE